MLKIVSAKVVWHEDFNGNHPGLEIVFEGIDFPADYVFKKVDLGSGKFFVYSIHPEGFVRFNYCSDDHSGYAGRTFTYLLEDGSTFEWVGPWSSDESTCSEISGISVVNAAMRPNRDEYKSLFYAAAITLDVAKEAIKWINDNRSYIDPEVFLLKVKTSYGEYFLPSLSKTELKKPIRNRIYIDKNTGKVMTLEDWKKHGTWRSEYKYNPVWTRGHYEYTTMVFKAVTILEVVA